MAELPPINAVNDQYGNPIDSDAAGDEDNVVINIGGVQINNFSSFTFRRDFFHPIDTFELVLEDDDISQLTTIPFTNGQILALTGLTFQFIVNGACQFNGFVYTAEISNNRSGGSRLDVHCRNTMGVVSDSTLPPQLKYDSKTQYSKIMRDLFADFGFRDNFQFEFEDDTGLLATASGGFKAKFAKQLQNLTGNIPKKKQGDELSKLLQPYPNEGIMEFAQKLCHRIGWNIQQFYSIDKFDTVSFLSPIYNRAEDIYNGAIITRTHKFPIPVVRAGTNANLPTGLPQIINVLDGRMHIDWSHQASVIIGECSMYGGNFYRSDEKFVAINEIVAYDNTGHIRPEVQEIIDAWVTYNGTANNAYQMSFNYGLFATIAFNNFLGNPQIPISPFARPVFIYDQESATQSELDFSMRRKMYDLQNSFLTIHYVVQGLTANGIIWQTNTMVNTYDDSFSVTPIEGPFWIKSVVMNRSRSGGTRTTLELKLPYIYDFEYGTG